MLLKNISTINISRSSPNVYFGDVRYHPGGEFGPRIQQDYQLVIINLGEARVTFDTHQEVIPAGSVGLMLPGRREYFHFSQRHSTHHTWCAVQPRVVPPALRRRLARLPSIQPQSQSFNFIIKAAFGIRSWRQKRGLEMLTTLGLAALQEFARMAETDSGEAGVEGPCERARFYLEEHCAEEDCLKKAAQSAGVTPQHLIRLFHQYLQMTPGRYLWQLRVERGAGLLTATGLTVSEIAFQCGFKNPFHFSRLLRKLQGLSPRQLRHRAWQKSKKRIP